MLNLTIILSIHILIKNIWELGVVLDSYLNFNTRIDQKIKRLFSVHLPRNDLLTIIKSFISPHLDYGDILYDKPNYDFLNKMEKVQY